MMICAVIMMLRYLRSSESTKEEPERGSNSYLCDTAISLRPRPHEDDCKRKR